MKSATRLFMMVLVTLLLTASVSSLYAQFTLKIAMYDGDKRDTLTVGENAAATYGTDASLGEVEAPVAPPDLGDGGGVFDVRLIAPVGDTTGFGVGRKVDIRQYVSAEQSDTFEVQFQSGLVADGGTNMEFSWNPSDLAGFRWRILDAGSLATLANMGTSSSWTVPTDYYIGGNPANRAYVLIVKSLATQFRSFSYSTLALDVDNKLKQGKAVKPKPHKVHFTSSFTNPATNVGPLAVNDLVLKFGVAVDRATLVVNPPFDLVTWKDDKNTQVTLHNSADLAPDAVYSITAIGLKGKAQKITAVTSKNQGKLPKQTKSTLIVVSTLYVPMPNTVNLGEWLYTNGGLDLTNGIIVGSTENLKTTLPTLKTPKDTFKYVIHPKYKDALKSMAKLTQLHTSGTAGPFGMVAGKLMVKKQKALPPDKSDNGLFGQALALKLNVLFSANGLTPTGFGNLVVVNTDGGPEFSSFVGKSFSEIAVLADTFLTKGSLAGVATPSASDFYLVLNAINNALTGTFDTASWSGGKPVLTGARYASDYSWIGVGGSVPAGNVLRSAGTSVPQSYTLQQNYPNPFNPTTTISFTLPEDGFVSIAVFNMLGQQVRTLANHEQYDAGTQEVEFNASELASGAYFYRILVNDLESGSMKFQQVRKMMLVK